MTPHPDLLKILEAAESISVHMTTTGWQIELRFAVGSHELKQRHDEWRRDAKRQVERLIECARSRDSFDMMTGAHPTSDQATRQQIDRIWNSCPTDLTDREAVEERIIRFGFQPAGREATAYTLTTTFQPIAEFIAGYANLRS